MDVTTAERPRPLIDVRGADPYIINGNARCSIGFSVQGGFVTAGHCGRVGARTSDPNGTAQDYDRASVDVLRELGVTAAVTTVPGLNTAATRPLELHRDGTVADVDLFGADLEPVCRDADGFLRQRISGVLGRRAGHHGGQVLVARHPGVLDGRPVRQVRGVDLGHRPHEPQGPVGQLLGEPRQQLEVHIERLRRILATDGTMSATRQAGNRLAYAWLLGELERTPLLLPTMVPTRSVNLVNYDSRRGSSVEILEVGGWR